MIARLAAALGPALGPALGSALGPARLGALAGTVLAIGGAGLPAAAQDAPAELAAAAIARLDAAADALAAAEDAGGAARIAALTAAIRAHEDGLAALRAGLRAVAARERAQAAAFAARSGEVSRLLGVMAAIERGRVPQTLAHPDGPIGTVRAAMILDAVMPALQAEAGALRAELDALATTRLLQADAARRLGAALADLQSARADLAQSMADRAPLPARAGAGSTRLAALLEASDTLAAFAEGLSVLPTPAAPTAAAPRPGTLPLPVSGTVLRRFGETGPEGVPRPGLTLATMPGALVTAPVAATVRYAGPLLDYGNVMVLEPAAGFLLVLAGLGDTYAAGGTIVAAGAPLGLTQGSAPRAPRAVLQDTGSAPGADIVPDAAIARSETLYIEVREDRRPVDPATWFAMDRQE